MQYIGGFTYTFTVQMFYVQVRTHKFVTHCKGGKVDKNVCHV